MSAVATQQRQHQQPHTHDISTSKFEKSDENSTSGILAVAVAFDHDLVLAGGAAIDARTRVAFEHPPDADRQQ